MIIGSANPLSPGTRVVGLLSDKDGIEHAMMPMMVLRVATREEYEAYTKEHGNQPPAQPEECVGYYEISID